MPSRNITFDLDANDTGALRTVQIKATDGVNDPKFTITQEAISQGNLNFASGDNAILMNTILTGKS